MTEVNDELSAAPAPSSRGRVSRRIIVFLCLAGAVVAGGSLCLPIALNAAGHFWAVSDPLQHADAAIVIGGGCESRPPAAAQLYRNGEVRQILLSTAGPHFTGPADPHNSNCEALTALGVPAFAIVTFGTRPTNTYEEARAAALWAEQNQLRSVIVPIEIFSSRRVRWIMRHELGKVGVDVRVETLTPKDYDLDDWWESRSGRDAFATEIVKYLYYRIRYWRS